MRTAADAPTRLSYPRNARSRKYVSICSVSPLSALVQFERGRSARKPQWSHMKAPWVKCHSCRQLGQLCRSLMNWTSTQPAAAMPVETIKILGKSGTPIQSKIATAPIPKIMNPSQKANRSSPSCSHISHSFLFIANSLCHTDGLCRSALACPSLGCNDGE